jgi:hypothetical protein
MSVVRHLHRALFSPLFYLVVIPLAANAGPAQAVVLGVPGFADASACGYINSGVGCVADSQVGAPAHATAGNVGEDIAFTKASADPAENSGYASAEASLMSQPDLHFCCGGTADATAQFQLELVNKGTGQPVTTPQSWGLQIAATANATEVCGDCGDTDATWTFTVTDAFNPSVILAAGSGAAHSTQQDQSIVFSNAMDPIISHVPSLHGDVVFDTTAAAIDVNLTAFAEILAYAKIDPIFTVNDPNVEIVTAGPINAVSDPVFSPDIVAHLIAEGVDVSDLRSLGFLGSPPAAVPEPSSLVLLVPALIALPCSLVRRRTPWAKGHNQRQ